MSKKLIQQLKSFEYDGRINPDRVWVSETKKDLMMRIRNSGSQKVSRKIQPMKFATWFMPSNMAYFTRPAMALFIIATLTVGGWIAGVNASYNSLPGDTLYGVKLAAEKTQVAFAVVTRDKQVETQLHLEFASRRSKEAKDVIANNPQAKEQAQVAVKKIKKSIDSAKSAIEKVGQKDLVKAVALAKDINTTKKEIISDLKDLSEDVTLAKEVVDATSAVNDAALDTVEDIVEKIVEDDAKEVVEEKKEEKEKVAKEVVELVTGVIDGATDETKENLETGAIDLKELSDTVQSETFASSTKAIDPKKTDTTALINVSDVTSTPQVAEKVVKEAEQQVDAATELVDDILEEARDLVEGQQLVEAIKKVKQATEVNKEAAEVVVKTKEVVQKAQENIKDVSEDEPAATDATDEDEEKKIETKDNSKQEISE